MSNFLDHLDWRFAAKDFDTSQPVPEEKLEKILESIHYSPSSYGLQPYHVYVVKDQETKEKLHKSAWNQPQVLNGSHILVFCARTDVQSRVDIFTEVATGGNPEIKEKMSGYLDILNDFATNTTGDKALNWAARQTYIALGFAMAAAAELEVDSCPMEGFVPEEFDKALSLPEHMHSVVVLALGKRTSDPKRSKFRYGKEDLFTQV